VITDVLSVTGLEVYYRVKRHALSSQLVKAVDGLDFSLASGEIFGLVGESGCGKSTTAKALTKLAPITGGHIWFCGTDFSKLEGRRLRAKRKEIQMIFQDPYASLNPRLPAASIIAEPLKNFGMLKGRAARKRALELMGMVALDPALALCYPHEFSGGQRQRIAIARALAARPKLLVLDEPVSALDVSIQAQIIDLLLDLRRRLGLTMLFISHDLAVIRQIADRVAVMYRGKIVEQAACQALFETPLHPYTRQLLAAAPNPDPDHPGMQVEETGFPAACPQTGCLFVPRCPAYQPSCKHAAPELTQVNADHWCACFVT
jgi:oligopeptide/dipeptide ABC transporter ATP-binding protein